MQPFQLKSVNGKATNGVAVSTPSGPRVILVTHWGFGNIVGKTIVYSDDTPATVKAQTDVLGGVSIITPSRAPAGLPSLGDATGAAVVFTSRGDFATTLSIDDTYRYATSTKFDVGDSGSPVMVGDRVVGLINNPTVVTRLSGVKALSQYIRRCKNECEVEPVKSYRNVVLSYNPVAYWPMRDAGYAVSDATGGANATVNNSPTFGSLGPINRERSTSISFVGSSSQWINAGTVGGFGSQLATPSSVSIWLKTSSTAGMVAYGIRSGSLIYEMNLNVNFGGGASIGSITLNLRDTAGVLLQATFSAGAALYDGSWHHIVGVSKPNTASGDLACFFDGVSLSPTYGTRNKPATFSNWTQNFGIGARVTNNTPATYFTGQIAEMSMHNNEILPGGAEHLYLAGINGVSYPIGNI